MSELIELVERQYSPLGAFPLVKYRGTLYTAYLDSADTRLAAFMGLPLVEVNDDDGKTMELLREYTRSGEPEKAVALFTALRLKGEI